MKNILLLGAGLVARPLVRYLLDIPDFHLTIATRTVSKAEKLLAGHPDGEYTQLDLTDLSKLDELVPQADLVISLVPYTFHVQVAEYCLKYKKNMVTTSYVSPAMRALDEQAKEAGIIILNELGVDPGIDHMSAMRIIHNVQKQGGRIESFHSYCGGLPAPEACTTPFGYKFSWSPRGVVMAGKNEGRYLKDGQEVVVPGSDLFGHYWMVDVEVPGLPEFEAYPNRNSLGYIELYGLQGIKTMYRGTLRNKGWCDTFKKFAELGFLEDEPQEDLQGLTFKQYLAKRIQLPAGQDLRAGLAAFLKLDEQAEPIRRLEWLGYLSDDPLPIEKGSPMDVLVAQLLAKLPYQEGERDMIVLHHVFEAVYPDKKERITSTLVDYGIPGGDSAMSRTVSLPAAVGSKLILQGAIQTKGVVIPVLPEIYEPVLQELEKLQIVCQEKTHKLS